jgi:hypothetical protein
MAKQITEAKLEEAVFDVQYEFARFGTAWRQLDPSSPSLGDNNARVVIASGSPQFPASAPPLGNNNASAVVSVLGSVSNNSTVQPIPADPDPAFAAIEHILLHFRILIEFFFPKKKGHGYVNAEHYGVPRNPRPDWADNYERRCNELIAHLSYNRIGKRHGNKHHWPDILEKCKLMDAEITSFLNALPPDRRVWFR